MSREKRFSRVERVYKRGKTPDHPDFLRWRTFYSQYDGEEKEAIRETFRPDGSLEIYEEWWMHPFPSTIYHYDPRGMITYVASIFEDMMKEESLLRLYRGVKKALMEYPS